MLGLDDLDESSVVVKRVTQNPFVASNMTLVKANVATYTLLPLANFKRLQTITTLNKKYSSSDLNNQTTLTPLPGQFGLFDTNKAFTCSNNNFLSKTLQLI